MYRPHGRRIQELREAQKLTRFGLSSLAKIRRTTLVDWETLVPLNDFGFNGLARVASALVVPYTELIEYLPDDLAPKPEPGRRKRKPQPDEEEK